MASLQKKKERKTNKNETNLLELADHRLRSAGDGHVPVQQHPQRRRGALPPARHVDDRRPPAAHRRRRRRRRAGPAQRHPLNTKQNHNNNNQQNEQTKEAKTKPSDSLRNRFCRHAHRRCAPRCRRRGRRGRLGILSLRLVLCVCLCACVCVCVCRDVFPTVWSAISPWRRWDARAGFSRFWSGCFRIGMRGIRARVLRIRPEDLAAADVQILSIQ